MDKPRLSSAQAVAFATGLLLTSAAALVFAKGPTVKIVVSGAGLAKPIEITDAPTLDRSNVWEGLFADWSSHVAKSDGVPPYELSFYAKLPSGEVRKMYVVYYCPNPSGGPGSIYLPGGGEPWYRLNVGTIYHEGQNGKWFRASPEWERSIKTQIGVPHSD